MRFCFLFAITVGLFFGQTAHSEQSAPIVFDCFPAEDCESCDGCVTGLCGGPSRLIYHPKTSIWFKDKQYDILREIEYEPVIEGVRNVRGIQ